MDLLRAVILGAPGTPYHDGLFVFDLYLPPEYPHTPPVRSPLFILFLSYIFHSMVFLLALWINEFSPTGACEGTLLS